MRGRRDPASSYNGTVLSSEFPAGKHTGEFFIYFFKGGSAMEVMCQIESQGWEEKVNVWAIFSCTLIKVVSPKFSLEI